MFADADGNGVFNSADARILLRIAARLDAALDDISSLDISGDGVITSYDARLALRYSAQLDTYYADEDGEVFSGFIELENGEKMYLNDLGAAAKGYTVIDSAGYYFGSDGAMRTGFVDYLGLRAHFGDDGKGTNGVLTDGGRTYYYENGLPKTGYTLVGSDYCFFGSDGAMQTGFVDYLGLRAHFDGDGKGTNGVLTDGGKAYYYENGLPKTGFRMVNGVKCYFDENGLSEGLVNVGGSVYCVKSDGSLLTGWYKDGLDYYFFDSDYLLKTNASDDDFSYGSDGVAKAKRLNENTFDVYICDLMKKNGSTPSDIFNYVHGNFRYKYYAKTTPKAMAIRILKNGRGACYDFANLTKFMLEAAGYECQIIVGDSFNPNNGSEHDWVLVRINGAWRHMDTQRGYYLKTDSQMRSAGYGWNGNNYPAAN